MMNDREPLWRTCLSILTVSLAVEENHNPFCLL